MILRPVCFHYPDYSGHWFIMALNLVATVFNSDSICGCVFVVSYLMSIPSYPQYLIPSSSPYLQQQRKNITIISMHLKGTYCMYPTLSKTLSH